MKGQVIQNALIFELKEQSNGFLSTQSWAFGWKTLLLSPDFHRFMRYRSKMLLLLSALLLLGGCQVYHNTTAYYNAYFLANERLTQVEESLFGELKDQDYSSLLPIFPELDSTYSASQKANLEYAIEKASLPIELHKTSKWVDDSYLLIGKARLYKGDFRNAINTFKYVNGLSKNRKVQQASLIFLMRAFTETKSYSQVEKILENIRRSQQRFAEENVLDFNLHAALYYQRIHQLPLCAEYLELAIPMITPKRKRARLHYILGQIYQQEENFAAAFENYNLVLKCNPIYDLEFNARLRAAQVFVSNDPKDVANMQDYFSKLLRDQKNTEFKDKIYFEWGNFEARRGKAAEAIELFEQSLASNQQNKMLRALTYRKMGELYFEDLLIFEQAALYYDSAMQAYRPDMEGFASLRQRAEVLDKFIGYYKAAENNRILLNLSKLSDQELRTYFERKIEDEKAEIDRLFEQQQKRKNRANAILNQQLSGQGGWYFYNPAAIAQGQQEFKDQWGERPLEDNWRRSNKPETLGTEDESTPLAAETEPEIDRYAAIRSLEDRMAEVPRTDSARTAMHKEREKALFELGKMYFQDFDQPNQAVSSLETLMREYPENPYAAEALYLLVTLCREQSICKPEKYQEKLLEDYPKSIYADLLNPKPKEASDTTTSDAPESTPQDEAGILKRYAQLFERYENGDYQNVQQEVERLIRANPTTRHLDKIQLLGLMARGKTTTDWNAYAESIKEFITTHPGSELLNFANTLLRAAQQRQRSD